MFATFPFSSVDQTQMVCFHCWVYYYLQSLWVRLYYLGMREKEGGRKHSHSLSPHGRPEILLQLYH